VSAVAELTDALIAAGMTAGEAAGLLARAHAEMAVPAPSKAAIRTRRWRANRASQTVTERHTVTPESTEPEASPSVTERHKPSPCDGASLSLSTEDKSKKEGKREVRRGERLSPDWRPTDHDIEAAIKRGISHDRIPIVAEKFKNHWLTKTGSKTTSTNWHLNWCTWCINEAEWNGNGPHRQNGAPNSQSGKGRTFSAIALERARAARMHD
jgi:Ni/Co efflux regulator RcnB